jgi:hypothetical protein
VPESAGREGWAGRSVLRGVCRKKRAGRGGPGAAGPVELTRRTGRVCVQGGGLSVPRGLGVKNVPVMEGPVICISTIIHYYGTYTD